MDHQTYINPSMLYQTNEPEANELSFDLEEFINQYTMASDCNCNTSFESPTQEPQPEYYPNTTSQTWGTENYDWMAAAPEISDLSWEGYPLTAAQPNPFPVTTSLCNIVDPFEDFEQFMYLSPTSQSSSHGSSSTSPTLSDSYSPTTTASKSPESTQSLSPPSDTTLLQCTFCAKTFEKRHLLKRHTDQHIKPIQCPLPSCSHRTAKSRDMQRHMIVHHSDEAPIAVPKFTCPVTACRHEFKRKDHLVRHVKKIHPGVTL